MCGLGFLKPWWMKTGTSMLWLKYLSQCCGTQEWGLFSFNRASFYNFHMSKFKAKVMGILSSQPVHWVIFMETVKLWKELFGGRRWKEKVSQKLWEKYKYICTFYYLYFYLWILDYKPAAGKDFQWISLHLLDSFVLLCSVLIYRNIQHLMSSCGQSH